MNIKNIINVALLVTCGFGSAQDKPPHLLEQLHFSAEADGVEKPVPIPKGVLAILIKDEYVRDVLENEDISSERVPLSWFSASAIHLSGAEQLDLVVMGEGPLSGANVTTFWVFCSTADRYQLVLSAPAHDLIVKNTRWKSYRDIELISATAAQVSTVFCRFNGQRYERYRTKSEPIR